MKGVNWSTKAMPTEDTTKLAAARIKIGFRPKRSLSQPDKSAPSRQPNNAQATCPAHGRDGISPNLIPERGCGCDTGGGVFQVEKGLVEFCRSADHHPVVSEQQPAHRRHERDQEQKTGLAFACERASAGSNGWTDHVFLLRDKFFQTRKMVHKVVILPYSRKKEKRGWKRRTEHENSM